MREGDASHKEAVGRDRHKAEIALYRIALEVEDGAFRPRPTIEFVEWADRWLASLERKPSTVGSYRSTIVHAKEVFRGQRVRRIGADDVARFNLILRERGCSSSTRAKHLRVLGACMQAAVFYRYADSNPVRELPPAQRPRPERKEAAYFENDELPRLFEHLTIEPYRALCLLALKTGMRQGELLALRWDGVDLEQAVIRVRSSYTGGVLGTPKNRERRDVDLISNVVELLAERRDDARSLSGLVFPGEKGHGFLSPTVVLRRYLYPAMTAAEIGRVGPTQEKRTFHSFRHTFAKRALETGAQITWLSRHLAHSSLKVTTDIYGHWERAERKIQAAKMEDAFPV
ncbi:MAG TPA: site-specific integrase [Gaiellaceae bacterium]|nr:site-specific integrase [Gaiellaceae bacterium]